MYVRRLPAGRPDQRRRLTLTSASRARPGSALFTLEARRKAVGGLAPRQPDSCVGREVGWEVIIMALAGDREGRDEAGAHEVPTFVHRYL